MSRSYTCPACGTPCETHHPNEHTTIHQCPDCPRPSILRLLPGAILELTTHATLTIAQLPIRIARRLYTWVAQ